jgi:tRNA (cmo5U34)-methyltransferase
MNNEKDATCQTGWTEEVSRTFMDYGRYFVPERDRQMQMIAALLPNDDPGTILELCCGEGLLAEVLLDRYTESTIYGLDGSAEMLQRTKERLARFGDRFQGKLFDLAAKDWRAPGISFQAVVSSLAIHHLTGPQKQELFFDVHRLLVDGGAFIIADIVEHPNDSGRRLAAETWDEVVREQAIHLDGNIEAFTFFKNEGWNTFWYLDPEDIDKPSPLFDQLKWLENAGFVDVDVHWMLAGHAIFGARKPESCSNDSWTARE